MIHDYEVDFQVPIILERPFIDTVRDLVDIEVGQIKFGLNNEKVNFNMCQSIR